MKPRLVAPMLTASVCLVGCSPLINSHKSELITGAYVDQQSYNRVRAGTTTPTEVEQLLGAPSAKAANEDGGEVWTWKWTKQRSESGEVFLLASGGTHTTVNESLHVEFRDGVATRKWRD